MRACSRPAALALSIAIVGGALAWAGARQAGGARASRAGPLVVAGGGTTSAELVARALELAGGAAARVLVMPQASEREDAGAGSAEMWSEAGAGAVELLDLADVEAARAQLARADILWMPGGDQVRLLSALEGAGLVEEIRARHRAGALVGGTSAGAAVLSERMLTGRADLARIAAKSAESVPGLGLWPGTIVDQHALRRQRSNRLFAAVLDHPELVGVAIDEETAVILRDGELEVLGESGVLVIDARQAQVHEAQEGRPAAASGMRVHLLRAGMRMRLDAEAR